MLQRIRDNMQGAMAKVIIAIIAVPFALFGADTLLRSNPDSTVGEVNGEDLLELDLRLEMGRQMSLLRERYGEELNESQLPDGLLRQRSVQALVEKTVFRQAAEGLGIAAPQELVNRRLVESEDFATDGVFDRARYEATIREAGLLVSDHRRLLRDETKIRQFVHGFRSTAFETKADFQRISELSAQKRGVTWVEIPTDPKSVRVTDKDIEAHYQESLDHYSAPDLVDLEYLEVSVEELMAGVVVSEASIANQYRQLQERFDAKPNRRVSHIMLAAGDDGAQLAESLLTRLEAGEDFAALAEQYSADEASAGEGGDLGYSSGDAFPEEFERALEGVEVNGIAGPVELEGNLHLLKLTELDVPKLGSYQDVREELAEKMRRNEAELIYAARLEVLGDETYGGGDLAVAAQNMELSVKTTGLFSAEGATEGIAANKEVAAAAFGEELRQGLTSDVLELPDDRAVVIKLKEFSPAAPIPLDEIRGRVREELVQIRAREMAQRLAVQVQTQLRNTRNLKAVAARLGLKAEQLAAVERDTSSLVPEIVEELFNLPLPGDFGRVDLPAGGYAVLTYDSLTVGDVQDWDKDRREALHDFIVDNRGQASMTRLGRYLLGAAEVDLSAVRNAENQ